MLTDILLTGVSLVLGGIIGFLISSYYYRKSERFEREMRRMSHSLEDAFMEMKYPTIYNSPIAITKDYMAETPKNTDIPHLITVKCETNIIPRGGTLVVLFQVRDTGINFQLTDGAQVRNSLNGYNIPVRYDGFAWMSAAVLIPVDAPLGPQQLAFALKDKKGNTNLQEFGYTIVQDGNL